MTMVELHAKLRQQAARLEGHAREHDRLEKELRGRAEEQLDSLHPVHDTVAEYTEADKAGGVLGQRRLRTLQSERERLQRVLARDS